MNIRWIWNKSQFSEKISDFLSENLLFLNVFRKIGIDIRCLGDFCVMEKVSASILYSFCISPFLRTNLTLRTSLMRISGLPSTATKSAKKPVLICPSWF
jgi:hypothetical protein